MTDADAIATEPLDDAPEAGAAAPDGAPSAVVEDVDDSDGLGDFRRYRASGDRDLRNAIVERHVHLVEPHLRRFEGRGIATDDLRQVALLALVRAIDRFDPDYGVTFSTFIGRTVEGELKRQLRDRGWSVRPPRRQQELFLSVRRTEDELVQMLGRSPTITELSRALGEDEERILEALEAGGARHATSLDQPSAHGRPAPQDRLAASDAAMAQSDAHMIVMRLLGSLDGREREVIELRFFEDLGQPEIAERLGLSQSYVSRLIRRILGAMREELEAQGEGSSDDRSDAGDLDAPVTTDEHDVPPAATG